MAKSEKIILPGWYHSPSKAPYLKTTILPKEGSLLAGLQSLRLETDFIKWSGLAVLQCVIAQLICFTGWNTSPLVSYLMVQNKEKRDLWSQFWVSGESLAFPTQTDPSLCNCMSESGRILPSLLNQTCSCELGVWLSGEPQFSCLWVPLSKWGELGRSFWALRDPQTPRPPAQSGWRV